MPDGERVTAEPMWALFSKHAGKWIHQGMTPHDERTYEFQESMFDQEDPRNRAEAVAIIDINDHATTFEAYLKEHGLELDEDGNVY